MPNGLGDTAPWILGRKRKWKWSWVFPKIMVGENYVGGCPLLHASLWDNSVAIWPPLGPPEWFLKIPKFTPYLELPPLAPVGASHRWLKTTLAPSSVHVVWKFQLASFKGSINIKGGVKHTEMEINRVRGIWISRKSQTKLSGLRPNRPENISPKQFRKLE